MAFGAELTDIAFIFMVALAVGGLVLAIIFPMLRGSAAEQRLGEIASGKKETKTASLRARFQEDQKDLRRRQISDTLKEIENEEKQRKKKKKSLRALINQAGLDISINVFWIASIICALVFFIVPFFLGAPLLVAAAAAFAGGLGLPRWFLGFLCKRRQNQFLNDFADAIDVMVRGLKAGLPVSEAMKIIASETGPPVGPEFIEVVDGQRVGIPLEQGIERMVERIPLAEVNFLAIVMTIQAKTGGNLSEALGNLSRVLRDRKKMKAKIKAVSQEAKSSAAIIGALPFLIMGSLLLVNPDYLTPLFTTETGNIMLIGSALWMTTGVLVMRKMINFEI
jgi:tight adherence protein B